MQGFEGLHFVFYGDLAAGEGFGAYFAWPT
jgi:hypothetical protein